MSTRGMRKLFDVLSRRVGSCGRGGCWESPGRSPVCRFDSSAAKVSDTPLGPSPAQGGLVAIRCDSREMSVSHHVMQRSEKLGWVYEVAAAPLLRR